MSSSEGRTRREILADAAKLAAAASVSGLAGCFPGVGGNWPNPGACLDPDAGTTSDAGVFPAVTPAVVEVFRQESVANGVIDPAVVATMLDAGLTAMARQVALFNAGSAAQAGGSEGDDGGQPEPDGGVDNPWKVLLPNYQAGQSIGLKVNCLGETPTSSAVVRAIIASLHNGLGVDPTTEIVVWDRFLSDVNGKYSPSDLAGAKVLGNLTRGLSSKKGESEDDPQFTAGHGYGDPICSAPLGVPTTGDIASHPRLSRILTDETALTINCPIFKFHNIAGLTGAMKNIYGMINNPDQYHIANFNTDMPRLYALPDIRNRISLTILDALFGVVDGTGPEDPHDKTPGRILLAQDPVALDSYALDLMKQLRTLSIDPSKTAWLGNAVDAGLGTSNYLLHQV
jgi:hypothetical protein